MPERESTVTREKIVGGKPSPWTVEKTRLADGAGWSVRIFGEHANEAYHASQARRLGIEALTSFGADEAMVDIAELLFSELGSNAIRYAGQELNELDIVWTPATDERKEMIDIDVVNPSGNVLDTPAVANRGKLAADEPNHEATHGRGGLLLGAYVGDDHWGQFNERELGVEVENPQIHTFAIIDGSREPQINLELFDEAA